MCSMLQLLCFLFQKCIADMHLSQQIIGSRVFYNVYQSWNSFFWFDVTAVVLSPEMFGSWVLFQIITGFECLTGHVLMLEFKCSMLKLLFSADTRYVCLLGTFSTYKRYNSLLGYLPNILKTNWSWNCKHGFVFNCYLNVSSF